MNSAKCIRPSQRFSFRLNGLRVCHSSRSIHTSQPLSPSNQHTLYLAQQRTSTCPSQYTRHSFRNPHLALFRTSNKLRAQPPTADALMENLTELYGTAKDEFEIAMEETEGNTVYAADDRVAAVEAFKTLKEAYEQSVRESDPETGKEVQSRVGGRIRELEAAIENMEKIAIEGD